MLLIVLAIAILHCWLIQDESFDVVNGSCFPQWFPWVSLDCINAFKKRGKLLDQIVQEQQPTHFDETSVRAFCTGPLGLHLYALLRFITGIGAIGSFMVCFVLAVEHVGYKVVVQPVQSFLRISTYSSFSSQCLSGLPLRCPLPWERCCWGLRWRWMHWTSKLTKSRPTSSVIGEPCKWCPTFLS